MKKNKNIFAIAAIMLTVLTTACGNNNDVAQSSSPVENTEAAASVENANKELTAIDPFEDLSVVFNGEDGSGTVSIEYTGDNDFIRDKVRFNCDSPNANKLSNGDVISVSARCTPKEQQESGYELSVTEKEYTVSELGCFIKSNEDYYSFEELDNQMKSSFETDVFDKYCKVGNIVFASSFDFAFDNIGSDWEIIDSSYELVEKDLFIAKPFGVSNSYNEYYLVYKINMNLKKVDDGPYHTNDETVPIGTTTDVECVGYISKRKLYYENHNSNIKSDGYQSGSVLYTKTYNSGEDITEIIPVQTGYSSGEKFTIS